MIFFQQLLLIISFICCLIGFSEAGNECYSCVSTRYKNVFFEYLGGATKSKALFPMGRENCSLAAIINCKGECFGIKIEEFSYGQKYIGYVHGCAMNVYSKKKLENSPSKNGEKICEEPKELQMSYDRSARVTYCRCKDALCNNPHLDFVNKEYIPQISSSESYNAQYANDEWAFSVSSSTTKSTPSLRNNVLAISFASCLFVNPPQLIIPALITFFIYQFV